MLQNTSVCFIVLTATRANPLTFLPGCRLTHGEEMIINTTYLQQASKKELLDAIDHLIMEYAVADMCETEPSKGTNETQ